MKRLVWKRLGIDFLFQEVTFYKVEGSKRSTSDGSSWNIGVDVHEDDPDRVHLPEEELQFQVLIGYG